MKVTYIQSATVIVENKGTKILCDPWFTDGEYYGSWAQYPPYQFDSKFFQDIDYIYVSHIHPDHCSKKTLSLLNKKIPILIHKFPTDFLKKYLENCGFEVIELTHNKKTPLKNGLNINIIAADNCDPAICGNLFGCEMDKANLGTNQIDTLCVFDNEEEVIVNVNDCVYEMVKWFAPKIKEMYKNIDMLLVGYTGASAYPHCYELEKLELQKEAKKKEELRLNDAVNYIKLFEPKYFLPFAGRFVLAGKLVDLNSNRGEPELETAFNYLIEKIDQRKSKGFLLNPNSTFDISSGKASEPFTPINLEQKSEYVKNTLSKIKFTYENENEIPINKIKELIPTAYDRFEKVRKKLNFTTETIILIEISKNELIKISCKGEGYKIINKEESKKIEKFIKLSLDNRLLYWILLGPQKAHWNNADIGSHIRWKRIPNIYERGLYYCLNFFHA